MKRVEVQCPDSKSLFPFAENPFEMSLQELKKQEAKLTLELETLQQEVEQLDQLQEFQFEQLMEQEQALLETQEECESLLVQIEHYKNQIWTKHALFDIFQIHLDGQFAEMLHEEDFLEGPVAQQARYRQ